MRSTSVSRGRACTNGVEAAALFGEPFAMAQLPCAFCRWRCGLWWRLRVIIDASTSADSIRG
jgi:hypothetical protein